jgi:hypothetical protein
MTVLMRDPIDSDASTRWLVHPRDANGVMVESVAPRSLQREQAEAPEKL